MANTFILRYDVTAPQGAAFTINSGSHITSLRQATITPACSDADTSGYQLKLWGDVDPAENVSIQATEEASAWLTFAQQVSVTLSEGDGNKSIYMKLRDRVHNTTSQVSGSVVLNTAVPVVTLTGAPVSPNNEISNQPGKDSCAFQFSADMLFTEYQIRVVPEANGTVQQGALIPTTAGSENMSGTGTFAAADLIAATIKGADLGTAVGGTEGDAVVKVFVRSESGVWSV